mgnify:CR=1 FL=1|tara:strand:+ start:278 stop:919 length:642 start_codon:yes stop_codon:yes gene_type:complete
MNKLILFFLLVSISYSQNNLNDKGKRDGMWIGYHENGQVKYQGTFSNGKEVGVFNYYNYDGDLVIKLNYFQVDSSEATLYYDNGSKKAIGQYINKQKEGVWTYFDIDGVLSGEEIFVNNKLNGECLYFFKNGKLAEKIFYVDNLKEGLFEVFYPTGFLNMRAFYHQDKLHGLAEFYYDGVNQIEARGKYALGLKDSVWIFLNEIGDTMDYITY